MVSPNTNSTINPLEGQFFYPDTQTSGETPPSQGSKIINYSKTTKRINFTKLRQSHSNGSQKTMKTENSTDQTEVSQELKKIVSEEESASKEADLTRAPVKRVVNSLQEIRKIYHPKDDIKSGMVSIQKSPSLSSEGNTSLSNEDDFHSKSISDLTAQIEEEAQIALNLSKSLEKSRSNSRISIPRSLPPKERLKKLKKLQERISISKLLSHLFGQQKDSISIFLQQNKKEFLNKLTVLYPFFVNTKQLYLHILKCLEAPINPSAEICGDLFTSLTLQGFVHPQELKANREVIDRIVPLLKNEALNKNIKELFSKLEKDTNIFETIEYQERILYLRSSSLPVLEKIKVDLESKSQNLLKADCVIKNFINYIKKEINVSQKLNSFFKCKDVHPEKCTEFEPFHEVFLLAKDFIWLSWHMSGCMMPSDYCLEEKPLYNYKTQCAEFNTKIQSFLTYQLSLYQSVEDRACFFCFVLMLCHYLALKKDFHSFNQVYYTVKKMIPFLQQSLSHLAPSFLNYQDILSNFEKINTDYQALLEDIKGNGNSNLFLKEKNKTPFIVSPISLTDITIPLVQKEKENSDGMVPNIKVLNLLDSLIKNAYTPLFEFKIEGLETTLVSALPTLRSAEVISYVCSMQTKLKNNPEQTFEFKKKINTLNQYLSKYRTKTFIMKWINPVLEILKHFNTATLLTDESIKILNIKASASEKELLKVKIQQIKEHLFAHANDQLNKDKDENIDNAKELYLELQGLSNWYNTQLYAWKDFDDLKLERYRDVLKFLRKALGMIESIQNIDTFLHLRNMPQEFFINQPDYIQALISASKSFMTIIPEEAVLDRQQIQQLENMMTTEILIRSKSQM